jgi:protocatechuate 3,4-dioxygenase beta subunit
VKLLCWFFVAASSFAQSPAVHAKASISGVVTNGLRGMPLKDVLVSVRLPDSQIGGKTDAEGRYQLRDLPPGEYRVEARLQVWGSDPKVMSMHLRMADRLIRLKPGEDVASANLALPAESSISGKVLDENGEPVSHVQVFTVVKQYYARALAYYLGSERAETNERGEYVITGYLQPGRPYLLMAKKVRPLAPSAPADPKLRAPIITPSYFPGTPYVEEAQPVVVRAGGHHEGFDIRVKKSTPHCIDGVLDAGGKQAAVEYEFIEDKPATNGPALVSSRPAQKSGADGRFRICDLHPGDYRLNILPVRGEGGSQYSGSTLIAVRNEDRHDLRVHAEMRMPLSGDLVWDGEAPDKLPDANIKLSLAGLVSSHKVSISSSLIAGEFQFPGLAIDEYVLRVSGFPPGYYAKEIRYGGLPVLYDILAFGSASPSAALRVSVARDGGFIGARVADKDGNPVSQAHVYVMPADVLVPLALSAVLISGTADQNGEYHSSTLRPGKYCVVASETELYPTPESMDALLRARGRAKEVDVAANTTATVSLTPFPID